MSTIVCFIHCATISEQSVVIRLTIKKLRSQILENGNKYLSKWEIGGKSDQTKKECTQTFESKELAILPEI